MVHAMLSVRVITRGKISILLNALCIDHYGMRGGDSYLIKVFNECETFYCYDDHSALIQIARLCGCKVVVISDRKIEDWPEDRFSLADRQTKEFVELCLKQWPELRKPER